MKTRSVMNTKIRDKTEQMLGATIQHGPLSQRIYVMKIGNAQPKALVPALRKIAEEKGYTKIFAKIPTACEGDFIDGEYSREALIPGYFNGDEAAAFMALFLSDERAHADNADELERVLQLALEKQNSPGHKKPLPDGARVRACTPEDAPAMSAIYRVVFPTYPFPIDKPEYIIQTMKSHVAYFGVEIDGELVSIASAEMDRAGSNVEMTDFATLPDWLGNGFALHLLEHMEIEMRAIKIATSHTIARAISPGMNITFAKCGYEYGGQLRNNTNISGQIESMNIWFKNLSS